MASAVTMSGWAYKWPGRLGDSPIIGAGNYCDARIGAAACTGFCELSLRTQLAALCVDFLKHGDHPADAAQHAIELLTRLDVSKEQRIMHIVALRADGEHGAASTRPNTLYAWRDATVDGTPLAPRRYVALTDPGTSA